MSHYFAAPVPGEYLVGFDERFSKVPQVVELTEEDERLRKINYLTMEWWTEMRNTDAP
jgi:hypothetical protein